MTEVEIELSDVVRSIRAVSSEQEKLIEDMADLRSQFENEVHDVEQRLNDGVKRLKETVLCCPPVFVKICIPRDSNLRLNLDRNSERPWISSCFYTHPEGYKLCLALKSTEMSSKPWVDTGEWYRRIQVPRYPYPTPSSPLLVSGIQPTRKPNLFLSALAVSQEDDDHRTWPCEGAITLRLLGQRKCNPFTIKVSIGKSSVIEPDAVLDMNQIKEWVQLPEEVIPFRECKTDLYTAGDIPSTQLDIRIETVILSEESKVWNC